MPPAQQTVDGLWFHLCPSFSYTRCLRSSKLRAAVLSPRPQCLNISRLLPQQVSKTGCLFPDPNTFSWRSPHVRRSHSYAFPTKNDSGTHSGPSRGREAIKPPDKSALGRLQTAHVYEELRRVARLGDFLRVDAIIAYLLNDRHEPPDARLYVAQLLACANEEHGSPEEVRRLFQEMEENNVSPTAAVLHAALKVLAVHPDYILRNELLEELQQRWFPLTDEGWHDVIVGLLRDRQIEIALDKLDQMRREKKRIQSWLYDIVVYVLCEAEEFDEVFRIMRNRIYDMELSISPALWSHVLDTASRSLHHKTAAYAWSQSVEPGYLNPSSGICVNVLNTAARHGNFKLATEVFRFLSSRSAPVQSHHYEALIDSYINASDVNTASSLLTVMASSNVPPSDATTRSIYTFLKTSPSLIPTAVSTLRRLRKEERPIPLPAINVIIESFIHHSNLNSAIETYKILHTLCPSGPNTATFNFLFKGCAEAGRKDLALFYASEMLFLKIRPDAQTYEWLVLACLNGPGEEDHVDACRYLEEMSRVGWWPAEKTVFALAKRLCVKRDKRVWGLLEDMERRGTDVDRLRAWVGENWNEGVEAGSGRARGLQGNGEEEEEEEEEE